MNARAVHAGAAKIRKKSRMNVDDPPVIIFDDGWRNLLQISGENYEVDLVAMKKLVERSSVACAIENFCWYFRPARAIEGSGGFLVRCYERDYARWFFECREIVDDCLEICSATRCENGEPRIHSAILAL